MIRNLTISISVTLYLLTQNPTRAEDDILYRASISCWSIALIETAKYPETDDAFRLGNAPVNKDILAKAQSGAVWTNRAFYSRRIAGETFQRVHKRIPSNGELDEDLRSWLAMIVNATNSQRAAIAKNCEILFREADRYCSKAKCLIDLNIGASP